MTFFLMMSDVLAVRSDWKLAVTVALAHITVCTVKMPLSDAAVSAVDLH